MNGRLAFNYMRQVHGYDFEAVDESGLMIEQFSGRARTLGQSPFVCLPLFFR